MLEGIYLAHNWWDKPNRENGRWVLRFYITLPGLGEVTYSLKVQEMRQMVDALENPAAEDNLPHGSNKAWWAYEKCQHPDEGDGYDFADMIWKDVPLILYRDDHFHVTLPHDMGEQMMEIIKDRLAEIGETAASTSSCKEATCQQ